MQVGFSFTFELIKRLKKCSLSSFISFHSEAKELIQRFLVTTIFIPNCTIRFLLWNKMLYYKTFLFNCWTFSEVGPVHTYNLEVITLYLHTINPTYADNCVFKDSEVQDLSSKIFCNANFQHYLWFSSYPSQVLRAVRCISTICSASEFA